MRKTHIAFLLSVVFAASCGEPADNIISGSNDTAVKAAADENVTRNTDDVKPPKGFYWNYDVPTGVEEAVDMTEEEAVKIMTELSESDGNFFGLELWDGSIVQFMYDGQNKTWFLDIPNPVTQESHNSDVTRDEVIEIIHQVYDGADSDVIKAGNPPN